MLLLRTLDLDTAPLAAEALESAATLVFGRIRFMIITHATVPATPAGVTPDQTAAAIAALVAPSHRANAAAAREERGAKPGTGNTHLLGKTGVCNGPLRPSGVVIIDGQSHPAKSELDY